MSQREDFQRLALDPVDHAEVVLAHGKTPAAARFARSSTGELHRLINSSPNGIQKLYSDTWIPLDEPVGSVENLILGRLKERVIAH